jgi:hypothetical protein
MSNVVDPPASPPIAIPLEKRLAVELPHAISWISLWALACLHALAASSDPLLVPHDAAFIAWAGILSVVTSFNWTSWTTAKLPHSVSGWCLGAAAALHFLAGVKVPVLQPFDASFLGLAGILSAVSAFNWKDVLGVVTGGFVPAPAPPPSPLAAK